MPILYRLDAEGGFTVGDTDSGFASYAYPSSPHADAARKNPKRVAAEMHEQAKEGAWMRAAGAPAAEQITQSDARMIAQLEAGRVDGSTRELPSPELSPSELVQQAEARHGGHFDAWEVSQVIEWRNIEYQYQPNYCEPLHSTHYDTIEEARLQDDYVADFWTVYGHMPDRGVEAIKDFPTEEAARSFLEVVTGDRTADQVPYEKGRVWMPNGQPQLPSPLPTRDPMADLMRALGPDVAQLGEGIGGQVIDWPEQPDTYHGQRDQRAEEGRPIEPAARLLAALRAGMGEQGATVTNHASQERGGLEPGDRVFLASRSTERERW